MNKSWNWVYKICNVYLNYNFVYLIKYLYFEENFGIDFFLYNDYW